MEEIIPADSPRLRGGDASSPEFEFWMVDKNPASLPPPALLTADELFVDGVLLPLDLLSLSQTTNNNENPNSTTDQSESAPTPTPTPTPLPPPCPAAADSPANTRIALKWKDLFKVGEKTLEEIRERRNQRRRDSSVGGVAELNIHIWPFSRSRSAGNSRAGGGVGPWSSTRLRASRKVSSAPCSRSNSRGESSKPAAGEGSAPATATASSSRRWAANSARPVGIRLGRAGPIVKLRRKANNNSNANQNSTPAETKEKTTNYNVVAAGASGGRRAGGNNPGVRVLNFNVNTCIGYRDQVSCKVPGDDGGGSSADAGGRGSNGSLFYLRTIFSKKVY